MIRIVRLSALVALSFAFAIEAAAQPLAPLRPLAPPKTDHYGVHGGFCGSVLAQSGLLLLFLLAQSGRSVAEFAKVQQPNQSDLPFPPPRA